MSKEIKIIRSKVSLATLHNRRDFGKRLSTLDKFADKKEIAIKDFNLSNEKAFMKTKG
tara:strand:- start:277 stop:450 length:174 start_codon:yes stop_codon:yes gene_type:complete